MAPGTQKSPATTAKREIVVVASFPYPWASLKEEIDALDQSQWNPSVEDMRKVAEKDAKSANIFDMTNLEELLGAISDAADGTLERLIVITHSNDSLIALAGSMSYGGVKGQVGLGTANPSNWMKSRGLDQNVVNWLNTDNTQGRPQRDAARAKFTADGEVIFVSCHGGGSGYAPPLFLMDFAGALAVKVKAYTDAIAYHPDYDSPNHTAPKPYKMKDRSITSVGMGGTQGKGFRHLLTSSNLRTITSPKPIP